MDFFKRKKFAYIYFTLIFIRFTTILQFAKFKNIAVFEIQIYNEGILQLLLIMANKSHTNMRGCK